MSTEQLLIATSHQIYRNERIKYADTFWENMKTNYQNNEFRIQTVRSESVNGTNTGRKSLPEDKGPDVPADASSSKDKAPEPSLVLLDKNQPTFSDLHKEDA
ncbi:hypothetical protein YC2023_099502 [Brassica napus]